VEEAPYLHIEHPELQVVLESIWNRFSYQACPFFKDLGFETRLHLPVSGRTVGKNEVEAVEQRVAGEEKRKGKLGRTKEEIAKKERKRKE
jgi:hypothetical protein